MDKNVDNSGEDSPPHFNGVENPRQNVNDALNEILATFTNRYMNGSQNSNENHVENSDSSSHPATIQSDDPMQQASQAAARNASETGVVEGIDPSSPLGRSIQVKFLELEEISRRLKSRLNQILCDQEILLSPDTDLEWDLNTDSRAEDLTPQEFSQLIQSQVASPSPMGVENSDKADDISK